MDIERALKHENNMIPDYLFGKYLDGHIRGLYRRLDSENRYKAYADSINESVETVKKVALEKYPPTDKILRALRLAEMPPERIFYGRPK